MFGEKLRAEAGKHAPSPRLALWYCLKPQSRETLLMKALETFAIYAGPFLLLGIVAKLLMQRYSISADDVQAVAGTKPKLPRRVFLKWRSDD